MPDRPDLEHHHAHRVGDHVVHLARHPGAFLGHRHPGRGLAVPLCADGPLLGGLGLLVALPQGEAGQPSDREEHGGADEVRRGMCRVVVDHDGRADQHEHQAQARELSTTETTQEEGRIHARQEDARLGGDQVTVEEAQRWRDDPDGGRRQEREAPPRQQGQDHQADRGGLEPQSRTVGPLGVGAHQGGDGARQRVADDQDVEAPDREEPPDSTHPVNVRQVVAARVVRK